MAALGRAFVSEEERNIRLLEAGNEMLQHPPFSKEELLEKLDNLEHLLSMVEQVPPTSARDAIQPAKEALIADGLLGHPDIDVKVSVASCISEIMRIAAPNEPYDDSILKDFFEVAVLAFGKLSCLDGRCYSKSVLIIEVLAKYRTCLLMWDLKLDALVVQMFQHFLDSIRPDHPNTVFMNIVEIMSMIINESEFLPVQLLNSVISSVQKENQNISPSSYVLGEEVLRKSAVKLQPYLPKAVKSLNISTNNYSEVVDLILQQANKRKATSDQFGNEATKLQVENGPEEPCREVACFDDVRSSTEETSRCRTDTDFKVAASNDTVVISVQAGDDSFKTPVNDDSKELSYAANYDGKVGPSLPGSSMLPTNDGSGELALHAAPESVSPFLDQPLNLLGKDPKHKDEDVFLETGTNLKESDRGDAMKEQKSTDSRTTSPPGNLGFINATKNELEADATQASKRRGWKPNFLNKPDEGYDDAWSSGGRISKAHSSLKGRGKDTKKGSSCSRKCAISDGLYISSGEENTPIMTSIKRCQKEKNDEIDQNDGAQFSSIAARDSPAAIIKKKVSQPSLVASEELAVAEALEKKHEKDDKKTVPARYRNKRRRSLLDDSEAEASGSVFSVTEKSNFPETSTKRRTRKNSLSQGEAAGSVVSTTEKSNLPETSKKQRKRNSLSQGEASGSIFSITEKSNLPGTSKKQRKRKNSLSQGEGKAIDDPKPPSTMLMQHNLTPKGVHQHKGIEVEDSEAGVNPMSLTTIKVSAEPVDEHRYNVKESNAPILAAIFAKYGDITVNCQYRSLSSMASLLDVVCDVVRRLKTGDFSSSSIRSMKSLVSIAAASKLDLTWLQQYLNEISEEEDTEKKSSNLIALSKTTLLISKAAERDLVERNREVLEAERRLKKAERRLQKAQSRAGKVKKSVDVLEVLVEKVQQDIKEVKDKERYWLNRLNELL